MTFKTVACLCHPCLCALQVLPEVGLLLWGLAPSGQLLVREMLNAQHLHQHNWMQHVCCPDLGALHCRPVQRWRRGGLSGPSACRIACISWSSSCSRRTSRRPPAQALQVGLACNGQPQAHDTEECEAGLSCTASCVPLGEKGAGASRGQDFMAAMPQCVSADQRPAGSAGEAHRI